MDETCWARSNMFIICLFIVIGEFGADARGGRGEGGMICRANHLSVSVPNFLGSPNTLYIKKIQHLRLNILAVFKSFVCLTLSLRLKYPETWWKKSLVMCSRRWGLDKVAFRALKLSKKQYTEAPNDHSLFMDQFDSPGNWVTGY